MENDLTSYSTHVLGNPRTRNGYHVGYAAVVRGPKAGTLISRCGLLALPSIVLTLLTLLIQIKNGRKRMVILSRWVDLCSTTEIKRRVYFSQSS